MKRRLLAIAVLPALASACTCAGPPSPTLESVSPARAAAGTATDVSVRGSGFAPSLQANLADPAASAAGGAFALTLVLGSQRVPLERVAFVSDRELSARVPPIATLATYDLELVDPRGRVALLPSAFTVALAAGCGPDWTPCDDGNYCTRGDACHGGVCVPGPSICSNTAPTACLAATPAGAAMGDVVRFDASCSHDLEDPPGALLARFDFDGDGVWDTPFAPIGAVQQHAYPGAGLWSAAVEVKDTGGLSDYASRYVLVTAASDLVHVTTAIDEADPSATPSAPGGTGLSLREAITYVNTTPGAPRTIRVDVLTPIVHASFLPALAVPGAAIVGAPAAPLQFPGVAKPCLTLDGPNQLLLDATVTGCTDTAVMLGIASTGSQVAECTITPSPGGHGIAAKASGAIGPRNEISGAASAVRLSGSPFLVEENRLHGNDQGIFAVGSVELTVRRNRITSNLGAGLQSNPSSGACTILHNVFDANGGDAADLASCAGGVVVRDNLFTRNGGFALRDGSPGETIDHNGFFGNARGDLQTLSASTPGPTDVLADPLYAGDHRIAPRSPAVDRGIDTGLDVNGPAPGLFNGRAPDLGAWESPYTAP